MSADSNRFAALAGGGEASPRRARRGAQLVGLLNQGATCYLNSHLQLLFMTPEFRALLFAIAKEDLTRNKDKPRKIPLELQALFAQLATSGEHAVSTKPLTDVFGWSSGDVFRQHDIGELHRLLLDAIDRSLAATPHSALVDRVFGFATRETLRCRECGAESSRLTPVRDLLLQVAGFEGVADSLAHALAPEHLEGWRCGTCGKNTGGERRTALATLPPVLAFTLSRYGFDARTLQPTKIHDRFTFPMHLDMAPFCEGPLGAEEARREAERWTSLPFAYSARLDYDLCGVVVHRGAGAERGHYHAYLLDTLHEGPRGGGCGGGGGGEAKHDPSRPPRAPNERDAAIGEAAVAIFARVLLERDGLALSTDATGDAFLRAAGASWTAAMKKTHGTMAQFFSFYGSVFAVSHREVRLRDAEWARAALARQPADKDKENAPPEAQQPVGPADTPAKACDGAEERKSKVADGEAAAAAAAAEAVAPALPPPPPPAQWFNFDDSRVSLSSEAALQRQFGGKGAKESAYILVYRRRWSHEQPPLPPAPPPHALEAIHEAKRAEVEAERREQLARHAIRVSLNRLALSDRGDLTTRVTPLETHLVASLAELRRLVEAETGIAAGEQLLHVSEASGVRSLAERGDEEAVKALGIRQNADLFVERRRENAEPLAHLEFLKRQSQVRVVVADRASDPANPGVFHLFVAPSAKGADVRAAVLAALSPEARAAVVASGGGRLRNAAGTRFLDDVRSMAESGHGSGANFVLERGAPPREGEVFLRVFRGDGEEVGVVASQRAPIEAAKTLIAAALGSPPASLTLRQATLSKKGTPKPGAAIFNETRPLATLTLSHGDSLYVDDAARREASDLVLELWLRTTAAHRAELVAAERRDAEACDDEKGRREAQEADDAEEKRPMSPFRVPADELFELGDFKFVRAATVNELRRRVAELPMLRGIEEARLRVCNLSEHFTLGQVHRDAGKALKDVKLNDERRVCVEVLPAADRLNPAQTLFLVARRRPASYSYDAPVPLPLRVQELGSLQSFKHRLRELVDVAPDRMRVALYRERDFKWVELVESGSGGGSSRSKKRAANRAQSKLVNEIARCADHTVVAVLDRDDDPEKKDDFRTAFDRAMSRRTDSSPGNDAVLTIEVDV